MRVSIIAASISAIMGADDARNNPRVVANLRESVTAISAQLAVIAETLQHLPAETREHEQMMKTLLHLREEHDSLKRRLQEPQTEGGAGTGSIFIDLWKLFFIFDGVLGAILYEQQVRALGDLRGEALWIRRIVTGTCVAVAVVVLEVFISLTTNGNLTVKGVVTTCLFTVRALLLASALLNDLMKLPKALQTAPPPPPPLAESVRGSSFDKARERSSRKLEISTTPGPIVKR